MDNHQAELIFDDNDEMVEGTPYTEEEGDEQTKGESGDKSEDLKLTGKKSSLTKSQAEQGYSRIVHNFGDTDYA